MTPPLQPIPGLGSLNGLDNTQRTMHDEALDILRRHDTEGQPFALFLRTFSIGFFYGDPENPRLLENRLHDSLSARGHLPIVTVQMLKVDVDYDAAGEPRQRWLPSLVVDDKRWLEAVSYALERADMIVSEVVTPAAGVMAELDAIERRGRDDRTVVVLPAPDTVLANTHEEALFARFARIIHYDEIDPDDPLTTFVFRDLVERMQRIDRNRAQPSTGDAQIPIRIGGLERGYVRLAQRLRGLEAWQPAALAYVKAAAIARKVRRRPEEHLYLSAAMWARCGNWSSAGKAIRQTEGLLNATHDAPKKEGELRKNIVALRADILRARGKWSAGRALLRSSIRQARAARNRELEAFLLLFFARYVYYKQRPTAAATREGMAACRRAIRLARLGVDRIVEALQFMGMIAWKGNHLSTAARAFEQALQRLGSHQPELQCSLLLNLGNTRMDQQRREAGESAFRRAFALARKHRYPRPLQAALAALGALGVQIERPRWLDADSREKPKIVLFNPATDGL